MGFQTNENMGSGGNCICPKCGYIAPHKRRGPCQEKQCPKCDVKLLREGSYHHSLLMKKTKRLIDSN